MMDRDWIDDVKIERRGENGGMNITVFVRPPHINAVLPKYHELVTFTTAVFHGVIDPGAERFKAMNAEVMVWSDEEHRGVWSPHRYRVTVDFEPRGGHEDT
jgi:hypothetical protein